MSYVKLHGNCFLLLLVYALEWLFIWLYSMIIFRLREDHEASCIQQPHRISPFWQKPIQLPCQVFFLVPMRLLWYLKSPKVLNKTHDIGLYLGRAAASTTHLPVQCTLFITISTNHIELVFITWPGKSRRLSCSIRHVIMESNQHSDDSSSRDKKDYPSNGAVKPVCWIIRLWRSLSNLLSRDWNWNDEYYLEVKPLFHDYRYRGNKYTSPDINDR
jgi:hypothetical protein